MSKHNTNKRRKQSIFPTAEHMIDESVNIGSVFLALESGLFSHQALFEWLVTAEVTIRTKIAYKAVCSQIHPNKQYLNDEVHFLIKKPEYLHYALIYDVDINIPHQINSEDLLVDRLCENLCKISESKEICDEALLVAFGKGNYRLLDKNLIVNYLARNLTHIGSLPSEEINKALIQADWTEKFRYNEKLPVHILTRISQLQVKAPFYYGNVAYKAYHTVVAKLYKEKLLTELSKEQLKQLNGYFPNIINPIILTYTPLTYKISLLGNDIAGYVLGFPIQNLIPTDDQIKTAINMLHELGPEAYAQKIKNYVKQIYTPISLISSSSAISYVNDKDVIMIDIDEYFPFDIVAYQTGNHIYRFSRANFLN